MKAPSVFLALAGLLVLPVSAEPLRVLGEVRWERGTGGDERLRRGAVVRGRLIDTEGKPVAGAELSLLRGEDSVAGFLPQEGSARFKTVSGPAGEIRFEHVEAGLFLMQGRRRGFAPVTLDGIEVPAGAREVDLGGIRLEAGAVLAGWVTDRRGRPLAGAEVWLEPDDGHIAMMLGAFEAGPVRAGPDGRFQIEDLPVRVRFSVQVQHPGYASRTVFGVEAPPSEPLRIELQTERILTGRVVDSQGKPVAEARVTRLGEMAPALAADVIFVGASASGPAFLTDAMGRFRVGDLEPGVLGLRVQADGYRIKTLEGIEIPEDREAPPLEIVLERGAVLHGRVLTAKGAPVAGTRVLVVSTQAPWSGFGSSITDEEGRYRLEGLGTGAHDVQFFVAHGRPMSASKTIQPGVNELDFTVPGGDAEVTGRAVGPDGAPAPGVTLLLRPVERGEEQAYTGASGLDGSFRFTGVADGTYRLLGFGGGFARTDLPGDLLVAGRPVQGIELQLARGATLTGRIRGLAPEEARGVQVHAESSQAGGFPDPVRLSKEGTYRIPSLSPGVWEVIATTRDERTAKGVVTIGPGLEDASLDLQFMDSLRLSGRILLDGAPRAGALVLVGVEDRGSLPPGAQAEGSAATGHDGRFQIAGLHPGTYRLLVVAEGGPVHSRTVDLASDQEVSIEIPVGTISGQVVTGDGEPVTGALISVEGSEPAFEMMFPGPRVRSNEQGAFEVPHIAAGSYLLMVEKEGFAPKETLITVTPGGTVQVQAVLEPGPPG